MPYETLLLKESGKCFFCPFYIFCRKSSIVPGMLKSTVKIISIKTKVIQYRKNERTLKLAEATSLVTYVVLVSADSYFLKVLSHVFVFCQVCWHMLNLFLRGSKHKEMKICYIKFRFVI